MGSVMGFFADVSAICLYAAPMEKLFQVLKYKSAVFINAHMVIAGLTNNCLWFTYGLLTDNWFIISPNILFISLNSFTLVLCVVFNPKSHPLPDDFHVRGHSESEAAFERPSKASLTPPSPAFGAMRSPLESIQVSK
ncbi:Bidirectional sugar transporter SWEET3b [Phytophthora ramorum]|nr:Bidirectional sugar transporter SWEET3b [Phytophthora ramorum]